MSEPATFQLAGTTFAAIALPADTDDVVLLAPRGAMFGPQHGWPELQTALASLLDELGDRHAVAGVGWVDMPTGEALIVSITTEAPADVDAVLACAERLLPPLQAGDRALLEEGHIVPVFVRDGGRTYRVWMPDAQQDEDDDMIVALGVDVEDGEGLFVGLDLAEVATEGWPPALLTVEGEVVRMSVA